MHPDEQRPPLEQRVVKAAETAVAESKFVSPIDILVMIGWLPQAHVDRWRQGRIPYLEQVLSVHPSKLAAAMRILQGWAQSRGLQPSEMSYVARTRDRRLLRFTASGEDAIEKGYRTHWVSPELSERQRERQSQPPDLVVIEPRKDWTCSKCGRENGNFLLREDPGPVCMACAQMDQLVFLPAGDATLSRRAKQASGLSAVVVRFSLSRKRYERQGILVEEVALHRAEVECQATEEARQHRRSSGSRPKDRLVGPRA
jgi:hypothetical protein